MPQAQQLVLVLKAKGGGKKIRLPELRTATVAKGEGRGAEKWIARLGEPRQPIDRRTKPSRKAHSQAYVCTP